MAASAEAAIRVCAAIAVDGIEMPWPVYALNTGTGTTTLSAVAWAVPRFT